MHEPPALHTLLRGLRAGDPSAREALALRLYPRVADIVHRKLQHDFRRNNRWLPPLFSTGDVVQEVLLAAIDRQLDGFAGDSEAELVQFLSAIVRHRLIDAVRYHEASRRDARRNLPQPAAEDEPVPVPATDSTPSLAAALGEQLAAYESVLGTLAEREQRLLRLRIAAEQPFADIAAALGMPTADAARQAFHTAKARLLVRLRGRGLVAEADS